LRALERTDRFVAAAIELMTEQGGIDFTVQEVVVRSRMSIRSFYNFFESKDNLLVAVYETVIATEVGPRLRALTSAAADPLEAIRAYIDGMFEMTAQSGSAARALTSFSLRLAETRPASLESAFKPQTDLLAELLQAADDSGRLSGPLPVDRAVRLIHQTVVGAVHARVLGQDVGNDLSAEELWLFCAYGFGARTKEAVAQDA
jgi:AcrR family transcriptional regulator